MGKITGNQPFGLSGRIDGFVYRQTREGVVVARQPRRKVYKNNRRKATTAQAKQQERFKLANHYQQRVLSDPLVRRAYERLGAERNRRYDRMVASDFLTPPEIELIELSAYHGKPGDVVRVLAFDDIEVVSVRIQIQTAGGALVEEGLAAKEQGVWNYKASVAAPANDHLVISVTAQDRAENQTTSKLVYP